MKRVGFFYEPFYSFANLYAAYLKAKKGSGKTKAVMQFSFFLESNLLCLKHELESQTYQPSAYRTFKIYDPKERTIAVAPFRDRVVHHAIINSIEPIFEKTFIYHSYATRKGKGTHAAILQAQQNLKQFPWFLKMDISKYFDSIVHCILKSQISKKIKDKKMLQLIYGIIDNGGSNGIGLPIGNLTSQFFANVYLNQFDHFVLEQLKPKAYIRYMDDFVLFDTSRDALKNYRKKMEDYLLQQLNLTIKATATIINQRNKGLSFLGSSIFQSLLRIKKNNLRRVIMRFKQKKHLFKRKRINEKQYLDFMNSLVAHIKFFDSYQLRQQLFCGSKPILALTV